MSRASGCFCVELFDSFGRLEMLTYPPPATDAYLGLVQFPSGISSMSSFLVNGGALGTPSSGTATNLTGTASGLTAGTVTTNANLTGPITSSGNATAIASQTGTGSKFVVDAGPTVTNLIANQAANGDTALTLNRFTDTSPTGNFISCKNAAATVKFQVAASGAVAIVRDDVATAVESFFTILMDGDATGNFSISNGTSTDATFNPKIQGVQKNTGPGLNFGGQSTTDTGTSPVILFASQIGSGAVTTRPLMEFRNLSTMIIQFNATTLTLADAYNITVNATTGTKIGTGTGQKLALWNKTPIVQPTTGITGATFVANSGTAVNDASTFGGYTVKQLAAAMINFGLLA
jgi:hypothetical protein